MNRRRFLKQSALAATACALPETRAAQPAFALNYITASAMYGDLSLATVIEEVPKTGAKFLDIWPKKWATQREQMDEIGHDKVAELLAKHGVKLAVSTRYNVGPFKLEDEMPILKKFGGSVLVVDSKGPANLSGDELKKAVQEFVEKMKPHVAQAAEHGITIAIENHVNSIIDSPDSLRWLVDFSQGLPLGVELAPYHLPQDTALIADLIKHIGGKLKVFCAWEHGMGCMKPMPKDEELQQMPGRGKLDFMPLLTALKNIRYEGFTEIFMHPTPRGIPILPTAADVTAEIVRARGYLEKCLSANK